MTIEQKPELNRLVDSSIPLTWAWRWRQIKRTLPIWFFIWACLLEMGLFKAWLSDRLTLDFIVMLLTMCLFFPLFVLGMAEIQVRIQHRSKRVIKLEDNKIIVKPAKNQVVRWKNVQSFQFEPLLRTSGLTMLTLHLHGRKKGSLPKRAFWAMVLEKSRADELTRYLQTKKIEVPSNYEIELLDRPSAPPITAPFPLLGMSLYMGGVFLLLHGIPLFAAGFDQNHHDSGENSKFSPQELAKLGGFLRKHFSSKEEFHHFFMALGAVMSLIGIGMMFFGWRWMNREKANYSNAPIAPVLQS
jgi:hypothetical protein